VIDGTKIIDRGQLKWGEPNEGVYMTREQYRDYCCESSDASLPKPAPVKAQKKKRKETKPKMGYTDKERHALWLEQRYNDLACHEEMCDNGFFSPVARKRRGVY
jgi:hypothetical protein